MHIVHTPAEPVAVETHRVGARCLKYPGNTGRQGRSHRAVHAPALAVRRAAATRCRTGRCRPWSRCPCAYPRARIPRRSGSQTGHSPASWTSWRSAWTSNSRPPSSRRPA
ncbi:hypothetical protein Mx9_p70 [Myxococcus phage Mx9]|nr:hypothetical protein Mx9_p70 [Myxococcus phage Mx9]